MSSGPTFYLPAFYTRPSLPSLPRITSPFIPAQVNPVPLPGTISILSFSALHDGLCSSPSCSSCVTSCTIISYNTIHLEITWYFGLLDCVCVCLCEILQHDFKSLIAETNCFLCFHKSCQKLSMCSVNICWPLLKTNDSHHHWSPRFYYLLPC